MTKKQITIGGGVLGVILIAVFVGFLPIWNRNDKNIYDSQIDTKKPLAAPKKIELNLYFGEKGDEFNPYIILSAHTEENCSAELKIKKEEDNKGDVSIAIEGYESDKCQSVGNLAVVGEVRNRIELAGMIEEGKKKKIKFTLNSVENNYTLLLDKYALYLEPEKPVNVISNGYAENLNGAKTVVVLRDPKKLVHIGVVGTYSDGADFNSRLKEITASKKYVIADAVLKGFDRTEIIGWDRKTGIAAFSTETSPARDSEFLSIGKIKEGGSMLEVVVEEASIPMNSYSF